jgi:hypothetical protein
MAHGRSTRVAVICMAAVSFGFQPAPSADQTSAAAASPPAASAAPPPSTPPPATPPAPPPAEVEPAPGRSAASAAPDPGAWLHQPEGQARLNRVIDELRQEVKQQTAAAHPDRAAHAYAAAYTLTPLHGLLIQVGRAAASAGQLAEARILYERLLAENPEPLLRAQATALRQEVMAQPNQPAVDADAIIKSYVDQGKAAFHAGDYAQSIAVYSMAYAMQDLPRLLFNLAQAYRRMGKSERAFLMYHRFLQSDPQTSLRKETEGYIAELRVLIEAGGPAHAPRPRWRLIAGGVGLGVGLGLLGAGAGFLSIDGQCVSTDATGRCSPVLDESGRAILPRTAQIFDTRALGASLVAVGAALTVTATVLLALPGPRLRPRLAAALAPGSAAFALSSPM